ncbi:MAG: hypothetical protein J5I47_08395 [Vicingus serpentipes]|nr:hypothetical protein [Vicingus serpentipes]
MKNESEYSQLSYLLFSKIFEAGALRTKKDFEAYDKIVQHPLLQSEDRAISIISKCHFNNIMAKYYEITESTENNLKANQRLVEIQEQNPLQIKENIRRYISSLYNLTIACGKRKDYNGFYECLHKLRAIPKDYGKILTKELEEVIWLYSFSVELYTNIQLNHFEEAKIVANKIIDSLTHYKGRINQIVYIELYYYIAYTFFIFGEYKKSIKWLNEIINNSPINLHKEIQCNARLLNLISHYELGNDELVEYMVKSVYRFLAKMDHIYQFEQIMFDFIKLTLKSKNKTEPIENFKLLKNQLEEINQISYERRALDYFDFISWLESKISNRSFVDVKKK